MALQRVQSATKLVLKSYSTYPKCLAKLGFLPLEFGRKYKIYVCFKVV